MCQLFPPRGHSFGQCDRNFRIMKSGIKNKPIIETPEPYSDSIRSCRQCPSPVVLVDGPDKIFNWSDGLAPYFSKTPTGNKSKFAIQQYVSIQFKPCGTLACSSSYFDVSQPFKYMITHPDEITLDSDPPVF